MMRPARRSAAVLAATTLALAGAACTSAQGPNPGTETTEPVPIEPNQEPETGVTAPEDAGVGEGTDTTG